MRDRTVALGGSDTPMPNQAEVARLAGVSRATVSNALNRPEIVRPDTLERVNTAIRDLQYVRNGAAASLAARRTTAVGIVVSGLDHATSAEFIRGAQATARRAGMRVLIADSEHSTALQRDHLMYLEGERMAGLLLVPMPGTDEEVRALVSRRSGVILLDRSGDEFGCCSVQIDNTEVGALAARHFAERGLGRIHVVSLRGEHRSVRDRFAGIEIVAKENPALRISSEALASQDIEDAVAAGRRLGRRDPDDMPQAVIAMTDRIGAGVIEGIRAVGAVPPPVLGCDDNAAVWGSGVPMGTVDVRGQEIGALALELLLDELSPADVHSHRHVRLAPRLRAPAPGAG